MGYTGCHAARIAGSSQLAVAVMPAGCAPPGAAGAGPPYPAPLVVGIAESERDPPDVLDDPAQPSLRAFDRPVWRARTMGSCQVSTVRASAATSGTEQAAQNL